MNDDLAGQIRRDLWTIRDHYDETLEPQRMNSGVKLPTQAVPGEKIKYAARPIRFSPPPIDLAILEARAAAHRDLLHYARVIQFEVKGIDGQLIQTRLDGDDVDQLAAFIDTWALHLIEQTFEGDSAAADFASHAATLRSLARPERRDWMMLGHCPFVIDGMFCHGRVKGYGDDRFPKCSDCDQEGPVEWWEEVMLGAPGAETLTHAELIPFIHKAFGVAVKRATLRTWLRRRVIVECGKDEQGRTLYNREVVVYALTRKFAA